MQSEAFCTDKLGGGGCYPTFDADNMLPDLLGEPRVGHQVDQVVDRVDRGVHRLEPLYKVRW